MLRVHHSNCLKKLPEAALKQSCSKQRCIKTWSAACLLCLNMESIKQRTQLQQDARHIKSIKEPFMVPLCLYAYACVSYQKSFLSESHPFF
jgi:hypothetical protein